MHHTNLWNTKLFLSDWRFALYLHFPYLRFPVLAFSAPHQYTYVILLNFVKIGRTVADKCWFNGFFKMAAVRHLEYVGRLLGPHTMTTRWSLSLHQIWLKSMQQFRQHETFNILPVWFENVYSRPKNLGFGGISLLKWGAISTKSLKGTSAVITVLEVY